MREYGKGIYPGFLYLRRVPEPDTVGLALVLAAPVIGHIFPIFHGFLGGKGIAASFGCLLGLIPNLTPVLILAFTFIFFSVVLRIKPHYYRTILTYLTALALMLVFCRVRPVKIGFGLIVLSVMIRMATSREEKGVFEVKLLWRR